MGDQVLVVCPTEFLTKHIPHVTNDDKYNITKRTRRQ